MFLYLIFSSLVVFSPSGPAAATPLTNEETVLKRPNTTESFNSSMSNGTTDAGDESFLLINKVSGKQENKISLTQKCRDRVPLEKHFHFLLLFIRYV